MRHNRLMRLPDRPEPGSFRTDQDNLAGRLSRLPDGHPSSPRAEWRERGPDELEPPDAAQEPDDPGAEPPGPADDLDPVPRERGVPLPRSGSRPTGDAARAAREPYRPWFTDGGPAEPWFAAGPDDPTPDG